ncbi:MAG: protein kinase domain-containing protein [Bacteroidota bacterium]
MSNEIEEGQVFGERYKILKYIGEGGMQKVYKANDLVLNRDVALKSPKNLSAEKRFHRSAQVAALVNHPNVAKTLDYIEDGDQAMLIEELVVGADLDEAIMKKCHYLDPYMVASILHRLSNGLAASHRVSVIHRDMKPTNIMISGGFNATEIKITDFGVAKMAEEEITTAVEQGEGTVLSSATAVGALPYMAPEVINTPREITCAVDIWALGAMAFEFLTGKKPFGTGLQAVNNICNANREALPNFVTSNPQFNDLSNKLIELIEKCLNPNPTDRPTAEALVVECSKLCYSIDDRYIGDTKNISFNAYGYIERPHEDDVFFHKNSVYGKMPVESEKVMFSKYSGGRKDRAYPIVRLRQP